jgi:hypothetical protein
MTWTHWLNFIRTTLLYVLVIGWLPSSAQTNFSARTISLREKSDTFLHTKGDHAPSSVLAEIMSDAIQKGHITAYTDSLFRKPIKPTQAKQIFFGTSYVDTFLTMDKNTGEEIFMIVDFDYDYYNTTDYRITINASKSGNSAGIGIAALRRTVHFIDNDKHRQINSMKPLYWVKYNDLKKLLLDYTKRPVHEKSADGLFEKNFENMR